MSYQDFKENWKLFSDLIEQLQQSDNAQNSAIIKRHIEQNLLILDQIFTVSIATLKTLQQAKSPKDILIAQTQFANEINKKIVLSTQDFLNTSLRTISDYNEWLKAHCDSATD